MGFEDEVEQSLGRPCRQTNGRSKRTYDLTSSVVPRGTSFHRSVEREFPPIAFDPAPLSVFRGRRGDLLKIIWWDGQGACLFSKRLERGRFVWPSPVNGKLSISSAQLAMLLEGIDWRTPQRTWRPLMAG